MVDATTLDQPTSDWVLDVESVAGTNWPGALTPGQQSFAKDFAVSALWALTGRRFGMQTLTVRPCYRSTWPVYMTFPALFNPWGGDMSAFSWGLIGTSGGTTLVNYACGCAAGPGSVCGCSPPEITLPGPVGDVTNVTIDGVVLDPTAYRLDGQRLVRQDGQAWPLLQKLASPLGVVNTWSVTYTRGEPIPQVVLNAACMYAIEIGKNLANQPCALPQRISSLTRNGVTAQMLSPEQYLDKGRTGIWIVDQVVDMYNPDRLHRRPRVMSPDTVQYR